MASATETKSDFVKKYGDKLSDSTKRAKWIHSANEHADHDGQTLATRDHDVIKQWAEERGGVPATVPGTEHGDHLGVLRINFPGHGGKNLEEVSWDEWFKTFDDRKLVFLYQDKRSKGNQSNFFHFDSPLREHD